jgi:hypothetical protein
MDLKRGIDKAVAALVAEVKTCPAQRRLQRNRSGWFYLC